jgi:predicted peroxiredoxin
MNFYQALFVLTVIFSSVTTNLFAGDTDPLFLNLTTNDPHRASMGIVFGKNQLKRGHPLTIFLNDKGVFLGSKANVDQFAEHQKLLTDVMNKGATVLICPMCMKHYDVKEGDLLEGIKVSNPELTGSKLFEDNIKTLSW